MKYSTGPMNAEEARYVEACKDGFCVACLIREESPEAPPFFVPTYGCEFHHFKSGNVRVGHLWGVGLCQWHHRGVPLEAWKPDHLRRHFGPSLMGGSRTFHTTYGTDEALLERQDNALRDWGHEPPARPDNRRWSHAA